MRRTAERRKCLNLFDTSSSSCKNVAEKNKADGAFREEFRD